MMKNLYNNLWRILVAGFLLVACTEDKGNYDYRNLTELEISGVDDNIIKALIAICCMLNDCLNLIITAVVNVQF